MLTSRLAWLGAAILLIAAAPGRADFLLPSAITGTLVINQAPSVANWYDPSMCHCATYANAANTASATVAIDSADTLFVANLSPLNVMTADLSITSLGDILTLSDTIYTGAPAYAWTQTFQDAALIHFTMSEIAGSDLFPANSLTFAAKPAGTDTLSFSFSGGGSAQGGNQTYTAKFLLTDPPIPEASAMAPVLIELGAIALFALYRRRLKAVSVSNH